MEGEREGGIQAAGVKGAFCQELKKERNKNKKNAKCGCKEICEAGSGFGPCGDGCSCTEVLVILNLAGKHSLVKEPQWNCCISNIAVAFVVVFLSDPCNIYSNFLEGMFIELEWQIIYFYKCSSCLSCCL